MNAPKKWYAIKTKDNWGVVADETTENTIAVTCNKADATLIAAAPAMLAALTNARAVLAVALAWPNSAEIRKQMDSAIARATEVQP